MNILRKNIFTFYVSLAASRSNKSLGYQCLYPQVYFYKQYCDSRKPGQVTKDMPMGALAPKYEIFKDEDASVILDVDEERLKYLKTLQEKKKEDEFCGLNMKRGVRGVYDIEDLVELLKREKLEDIFVVSIPSEFNYVDYIVVVTGKSIRHMSGVTQFIRKVYKRKMNPSDIIPRIEGENSKDWMAMDLGNIALHVFSRSTRPIYDLESLWALGAQYDLPINKSDDPFIALLKKHSVYFGDLQSTV